MNRDEFIKIACKGGYCNKEQAEKYCDGKDTFTDADFVGVYRMVEDQRRRLSGHSLGNGAVTSKLFYGDGGSEANR